MLIGYARVSKEEQKLDRQLDQLIAYGIDERNIYQEKFTGTVRERPELTRMIEKLKKDDIVVIIDITRISRSTKDLLSLVEQIKGKGASIKSLKDTWLDTTSSNPYNTFLLTVMSGLSQLERDLISQRTKEGLKSARARGRVGGRPKTKEYDINKAIKLYNTEEYTIKEITEMTGISKATLYNYIRERRDELKHN